MWVLCSVSIYVPLYFNQASSCTGKKVSEALFTGIVLTACLASSLGKCQSFVVLSGFWLGGTCLTGQMAWWKDPWKHICGNLAKIWVWRKVSIRSMEAEASVHTVICTHSTCKSSHTHWLPLDLSHWWFFSSYSRYKSGWLSTLCISNLCSAFFSLNWFADKKVVLDFSKILQFSLYLIALLLRCMLCKRRRVHNRFTEPV